MGKNPEIKLKLEWGKDNRDTTGNTLRNIEHINNKISITKLKQRSKLN